jgi:hypothetical protein
MTSLKVMRLMRRQSDTAGMDWIETLHSAAPAQSVKLSYKAASDPALPILNYNLIFSPGLPCCPESLPHIVP